MKKLFCLMCACFLISLPVCAKQGNHTGENKMLDVDIQFLNSYGKTVTNAQGVYYQTSYGVSYENKVYPSQYWGEYPLYYFGSIATIKVTVTNNGPRAKTKVRVVTESCVLLTSGSNGDPLMAPKTAEVEVLEGETKTIDCSFFISYTPNAESGLDRFTVKVLHVNEGGGPGNSEPALILQKEGVFCPPKYVK